MRDIKTYLVTSLLSIFLTAIAGFCFVSGRYVLMAEFEHYKTYEREMNNEKLDRLSQGQAESKAAQEEMKKDINEIKIILARKVQAGEIVREFHLVDAESEGVDYAKLRKMPTRD